MEEYCRDVLHSAVFGSMVHGVQEVAPHSMVHGSSLGDGDSSADGSDVGRQALRWWAAVLGMMHHGAGSDK